MTAEVGYSLESPGSNFFFYDQTAIGWLLASSRAGACSASCMAPRSPARVYMHMYLNINLSASVVQEERSFLLM